MSHREQSKYQDQDEQVIGSARNNNLSARKSDKDRFNRKSFRSRHSYTSEYQGFGPLPQKKKKKRVPNTILKYDERYFKKIPGEPNLFEIDVD